MIRIYRSIILVTALSIGSMTCVLAQDQSSSSPIPAISEQVLDERAKEVGKALRCVVCQNQSIEESDASLAEDMRNLVRTRIENGDSNEDVIAYMRSRYGDFVLLEPPVQPNTYLLWALPFAIIFLVFFWFIRRTRAAKRKV